MTELEKLEKNIESFLRKFYLNNLIRGLLVGVGSLVLLLGIIISLEYFVYMPKLMRSVLFYSYLSSSVLVFFFLILKPILQYAKLLKGLSIENAAKIIGEKVPGVGDKLTNTLELKKLLNNYSHELVEAGIAQKARNLNPFDFSSGVKLSENRPYVKYLFLPLALCALVAFLWPRAFSEAGQRIISFNQEFERPAPFSFIIDQNKLQTLQSKDFLLEFKIEGSYIPNDVFIHFNDRRFLVTKQQALFSFLFKNINQSTRFYLSADGYSSREYQLEVLSEPKITGLSIALDFPSHVGLTDKTLEYNGPLQVVNGTKSVWTINTSSVDEIIIESPDSALRFSVENSSFTFSQELLRSGEFLIKGLSNEGYESEALAVVFTVIEDRAPQIEANWFPDTLSYQNFYFNGNISDDYGLSRLVFDFKVNTQAGSENVLISPGLPIQDFYHNFRLDSFKAEAGQNLSFSFRVWDNDAVSGPKMSQSRTFSIRIPDQKDLRKKEQEENQAALNNLSSGLNEMKEFQKEMKKLQEQLLNKKQLEWTDKEALKKLLDQQKKLQEQMQEMAKNRENMRQRREQLSPQEERLIQKQKQIEDLMKNLKDERLEKLLEEMEKALDEMQKDQAQEKLKDLEKANEDLEKEMERTLELLKQLEFEQKLEENIKALEELKKKQEALSQKDQSSSEKQEELNKAFEALSEDLEEMKAKNEALEKPNKLPEDMEEKADDIKKNMEESKEQLDSGNQSKAKQKQSKSSEQMEELAEELKALQEVLQEEKPMEDLNALRRLLENLIQLSFDQESLIDKVGKTSFNDPAFRNITQEQKSLSDNTKIVEDSLFALSKRVLELAPTVNKEMSSIRSNQEKAIKAMTDMNYQQTQSRQQYVMTSFNNLALILDESIQNAQKDMSQQKFGNQSCSKPGPGKKPSAAEMKKKQEALKQAMEQLQKKMEESGNNPDGKKPGNKAGQQGEMSKELSKLAAEQAAIREQIRQLYESLNKGGKNAGGNLKEIQKLMEQTEEDLINKSLSIETIKRQEDIITRLLESEKAEREREFDEKRESNKGNFSQERNIFDMEEYKKLKQKENELLRTVPPNLSPYYKQKVSEYFSR